MDSLDTTYLLGGLHIALAVIVVIMTVRPSMSQSEDARRNMGEAARAHVEAAYSFEHVVDQSESIYLELSEGRKIAK